MDARSGTVQTSWKPIAAGVLAIIGGALKVLVGLGAYLYLTRFSSLAVSPSIAGAIAATLLAVGVTAIVGGSCAVGDDVGGWRWPGPSAQSCPLSLHRRYPEHCVGHNIAE